MLSQFMRAFAGATGNICFILCLSWRLPLHECIPGGSVNVEDPMNVVAFVL